MHEPIYEQCTRVIDKTGSCQIQHLYDLKEPIEHAGGPYNVGACEGEQGCINIWIGKVGDNYWSGHCSVYEESTQVRVVNPKAIKRAVLEYTKWDDYMMVYVGKQGQEELIWRVRLIGEATRIIFRLRPRENANFRLLGKPNRRLMSPSGLKRWTRIPLSRSESEFQYPGKVKDTVV